MLLHKRSFMKFWVRKTPPLAYENRSDLSSSLNAERRNLICSKSRIKLNSNGQNIL